MVFTANKQRTADLSARKSLTKNGLKRKKPQTVQKQFRKATPALLRDFEEAISSVIEQSQDPDPDDVLYSDIDSSDEYILYDSKTVASDCVVGNGEGENVLMINLIISSVL